MELRGFDGRSALIPDSAESHATTKLHISLDTLAPREIVIAEGDAWRYSTCEPHPLGGQGSDHVVAIMRTECLFH